MSWTVKNQGTVSTSSDWYDYIYISDDQFFDESDLRLTEGYTRENKLLASGSSYTITEDISIGNSVAPGDRYLLFVADHDHSQGETNETNNVFAQAIAISNDAPDLVVTAASAPASVALNETISVSWTVKNQGIVSAKAYYLYDAVYISDDQFFDNSDTQLASHLRIQNTPLASDSSYTVTQDISIPNNVAPGDRYLLFVADRYNFQVETNETNNVFAQAITINDAPDLVITAANAPTTAALGETISVSWTVKNQGLVSASSNWYDAVYISDDQFFDYSDTYLSRHDAAENTPLASGGSYTATQDISIFNFLQKIATGDRYLLFVADGGGYFGNSQVKTNETNNVFAQAITIAAPDLVITTANAPTTAVLGETISVSWTVKNQGTVSASSNWYDAVYISDDQFFDNSDRYLTNRYTGENTSLAFGGSYTATKDISIDKYVATTGDRYLLFWLLRT